MAYAFDTLGYAKRLRDAGLPAPQAEAHAVAAKDFIMAELATKHDLGASRREIEAMLANLELRLMAAIASCRQELEARIQGVETRIQELEARFLRLESRFDTLELRLTVRLGGMIAIAVAILAAAIKF